MSAASAASRSVHALASPPSHFRPFTSFQSGRRFLQGPMSPLGTPQPMETATTFPDLVALDRMLDGVSYNLFGDSCRTRKEDM